LLRDVFVRNEALGTTLFEDPAHIDEKEPVLGKLADEVFVALADDIGLGTLKP